MPRIAHTAAALALGALALTACSSTPPAATIGTDNVASVPEGGDADKPQLDFMKLFLKITDGCPALDGTKTGTPLGPSDVPTVPQGPSSKPTGTPGDRVPLPADPADPPAADDPVGPMPDGNLLEPVTLTKPETCYADKFAAHVTTALKDTGENAAEVRAALKRAGYPDERIVDMKPEGGSPRVRIDLREQDTRVALQVVHVGTSGTVVDKFGAQPTAPLKDVRYLPELAEPLS
ncbi:hypothetical protein CLM62_08975 [Streptomyces sp. SA15]|uniref:hypothetical protein n=1 Tax=Streptomyces sp. SA15 TaxID=934019 RepID=UPI000BAEFBEF|nr:hypothetical protein [Streptomyces sp. SA15]PAZ16246.1 hypothetical protein CLM62_08975 [Streptomyces sp. SA15]